MVLLVAARAVVSRTDRMESFPHAASSPAAGASSPAGGSQTTDPAGQAATASASTRASSSTDAETEAGAVTGAETEADAETEAGTVTEAEAETGAGVETGAEAETGTEPGTALGSTTSAITPASASAGSCGCSADPVKTTDAPRSAVHACQLSRPGATRALVARIVSTAACPLRPLAAGQHEGKDDAGVAALAPPGRDSRFAGAETP